MIYKILYYIARITSIRSAAMMSLGVANEHPFHGDECGVEIDLDRILSQAFDLGRQRE